MSADAIWKAFADSGDPLYYLLYRHVRADAEREEERKQPVTALPPG